MWTSAQRKQWLRSHDARKYYREWYRRSDTKKLSAARWRKKNKRRIRGYHHKKMRVRGDEARAVRRKWYHKNKRRLRHSENLRFAERRKFLNQIKNRPCKDCRRRFPSVCMDFDHRRGRKKFAIGKALGCGMRALAAELAKCDVVCANCHRIRTHLHKTSRRQLWNNR